MLKPGDEVTFTPSLLDELYSRPRPAARDLPTFVVLEVDEMRKAAWVRDARGFRSLISLSHLVLVQDAWGPFRAALRESRSPAQLAQRLNPNAKTIPGPRPAMPWVGLAAQVMMVTIVLFCPFAALLCLLAFRLARDSKT